MGQKAKKKKPKQTNTKKKTKRNFVIFQSGAAKEN